MSRVIHGTLHGGPNRTRGLRVGIEYNGDTECVFDWDAAGLRREIYEVAEAMPSMADASELVLIHIKTEFWGDPAGA